MTRKIQISLLLFVHFSTFAQSVQIAIVDPTTQEPLPFVSLYFKNNGSGMVTNTFGIATFQTSKFTNQKDTLICSSIGYAKKYVPMDCSNSSKTTIRLSLQVQQIKEVVVSNQVKLTADFIVKQAIKKIPDNYSNSANDHSAFYRETIEEAEKFVQLNESIVDIHTSEYPKTRKGEDWKTYLYNDVYGFEYEDFLIYPFLHRWISYDDKLVLRERRISNNETKYVHETGIRKGPHGLLGFDFVKYGYDFLDPDMQNKYVFERKEMAFIKNKTCYVIYFSPLPSKRKMIMDYGKKPDRSVFHGFLYIDVETFAIMKMEYQISHDVNYGFFSPLEPLDFMVQVDYFQINGKWLLESLKLTQSKHYYSALLKKSNLYITTQEIFMGLPLSPGQLSFPKEKLWEYTPITTLRFHETPYNVDFWKNWDKQNSYPRSPKIDHDLSHADSVLAFLPLQMERDSIPAIKYRKSEYLHDYPFEKLADDYHWIQDSTNLQEFHLLLQAENEYVKNYLIPQKAFQRKMFNALDNYYPKQEENKVHKKGERTHIESGDSLFYVEFLDSNAYKVILNYNLFKEKHGQAEVTGLQTIGNHILVDFTHDAGLNDSSVVVKMDTQKEVLMLTDTYSSAWLDENTLLYSKKNSAKRADKLFARNVVTNQDTLLLFEKDSTFDIRLSASKSYIFCIVESKAENEVWIIDKKLGLSSLKLSKPRQHDVQFELKEFNNQLFAKTNEKRINNHIEILENKDNSTTLKTVATAKKKVLIDDFVFTENFQVVKTYKNSFLEIRYRKTNTRRWKKLELPNPICSADLYLAGKDSIGISYSTPNQPYTNYSFDLQTEKRTVQKTQNIHRNRKNNLNSIRSERVWAKANDGSKIPITLSKSRNPSRKHKGLILKVYGSYGSILEPSFTAMDEVLLSEGFTIAIAHVRGERIMGNRWHIDGKLDSKENSFSDYISCAEFLIKKGYTTPEYLVARGNSAGGLVVAVAMNRRPDLFNTVILDHPFLDALNSMLDENLQLTVDHYKEVGNPNEKETYYYMKNYCPYINLKPQEYPNVLYIAGTNDFQTPIDGIAKHAAKLKEMNTGNSTILFYTQFDAGHSGSRKGKDWMKLLSLESAFIVENLFPKNIQKK